MPGTMEMLASLFKKGDKPEHRERADEVVIKLQTALNELSRPLSGAFGPLLPGLRGSGSASAKRRQRGGGGATAARGAATVAAAAALGSGRRAARRKPLLARTLHSRRH